ncbi:MAG: hypothetical protein NTX63_03440 [Candidatus Peregrinibacteria bacterium]|nr:hypothetical protein [Candidatus Peregrinibacteria bacterium]
MGGTQAPKETAPVVTPEQQATDAAKAEAEKRQTAAKEAQKNSAKSSLQALKDSIKLPAPTGAETSEVAPKVPKFSIPFTRDGQQTFLDSIVSKAKESLSAVTDEAKKEKLSKLYAGAVFDDFMAKFLPEYYFLLADGVDGNIPLDVDVDENGKVTITTKEQPKVDAAKKIAEEKAKEVAANMDLPAEMGRFQKDHPEAFLFLSSVVFKDEAEMKEAFAGKGLLGFFLGVLGYGGGKSVYGAFMNNKTFGQYVDSAKNYLAKLHSSLDFRTPVNLEKASDLDEYFKNIPEKTLKTVEGKFVVKADIELPAVTTFRSIVFPKGATTKMELQKASKDGGSPFSLVRLDREQAQDNITVDAKTILPAGTVFADITIGDKKAIEAALNGTPASTPVEAKPTAAAGAPEPAAAAGASTPPSTEGAAAKPTGTAAPTPAPTGETK